ncbi:histone-lysine N-methyltransferase SETMAR [Plakobranchus ocellatus]|uniref:Histone-lysine N-methyltransferase SETMAR n=1 Tax=Plakobranchus ocellatus TaxID=259542 RepID=A0AAV4B6C4_9GAST|nr:histone-lysine N-methyltransferase SETMAR [Plakobranchus ocellatus]
MAASNDLLIKQPSVIEFLAADGCSAANIHARMKTVYGEMYIPEVQFANGDESWVHHYDPECKAQTMEYRHKTSPSPRKFKLVALFTVFWDMEGVVHMKFLEQGQTASSQTQTQTFSA